MDDNGKEPGPGKKPGEERDIKNDFNDLGRSASRLLGDLSQEATRTIEKAVDEVKRKGRESNVDTDGMVKDIRLSGANILAEIEALSGNINRRWKEGKKGGRQTGVDDGQAKPGVDGKEQSGQ